MSRTRAAAVLAALVAVLVVGPVVGPAVGPGVGTAAGAVGGSDAPARPNLLPADDDMHECAGRDDSFFVPEDTAGSRFLWYCRNGKQGSGFRPTTRESDWVNDKDDDMSLGRWAARNGSPDGSVDFAKLRDEPCDTFRGGNGLERRQCLNLHGLRTERAQGVCTQWRKLIDDLSRSDPQNVPPYNDAQDGAVISQCDTDNPVLTGAYRVKPRMDSNQYSRTDFSAPPGVTKPLGELLSVGTWIALSASVVGILISAGRLALARSRGVGETAQGAFVVLAASVLAGSSTALAQFFLFA
ncbi:hypothetical protein [Streptodolium elevatio]|uniref:Uncharacterized protein n=1 Tax=Streptodolium elevatio TaxID=3157996 RepID=A0ABV3DD03_9ACTN